MLVNVKFLLFFAFNEIGGQLQNIITFLFKGKLAEKDECYNPESWTVPRNLPGVYNADVVCRAPSDRRQRRLPSEFRNQHSFSSSC